MRMLRNQLWELVINFFNSCEMTFDGVLTYFLVPVPLKFLWRVNLALEDKDFFFLRFRKGLKLDIPFRKGISNCVHYKDDYQL